MRAQVTKLQSAARGRAARQDVALRKSRSKLEAGAGAESTEEGSPEAWQEKDAIQEVTGFARLFEPLV